jgi:hypothetical protein
VPIRKGTHEWASGFTGLDACAARGRQPVEAHFPTLLCDRKAMVESQSQTDPQWRTTRRSTRLSAAEVRHQLIAQPGDADDALPTVPTLTTTRNALGYAPKKVAKSQPQKKSPTRCCLGRIGALIRRRRLRISMDAKALVTVGPLARGGQSRVQGEATDPACQPEATVPPVGILLPRSDALFVYGLTATVPRDGLVDRIVQWWATVRERFAHLTTLVIHLAHGPATHRRAPSVCSGWSRGAPVAWTCTAGLFPSRPLGSTIDRALLEPPGNHWHGALRLH